MSTRTLVPVEEYLSTDYEPDCDYVDGELIDRHVGKKRHSKTQMRVAAFFYNQQAALGIHVFPEQRIRVAATRYRVPDVCVVMGQEPDEEIFTTPPFLCIEILSPEDRASRIQHKLADYLAFRVPNIWVIDPGTAARLYTRKQACGKCTTRWKPRIPKSVFHSGTFSNSSRPLEGDYGSDSSATPHATRHAPNQRCQWTSSLSRSLARIVSKR
jgi:Uma2 family endonuclease